MPAVLEDAVSHGTQEPTPFSERACPRCGRPFQRRRQAKWCSNDCRTRACQERAKTRDMALAYKAARGCMECPERDPALLQFHHRDPATRAFMISESGWRSWAEVLAEIEKCDVLCVGCHSRRTRAMERGGETSVVTSSPKIEQTAAIAVSRGMREGVLGGAGRLPEMPQAHPTGHSNGNGAGTNEAAAAAVRQALCRRLRVGAEDAILRRVRSFLTRRPQ